MSHRDVVYLAENGLLRLSIRVFHVHIEKGSIEGLDNGQWLTLPTTLGVFTGFLDLHECDVFHLFRDGQVTVDNFAAPQDHYCNLCDPSEPITVRQVDVVVLREERDRVEEKQGFGRDGLVRQPPFQQRDDYAEVQLGNLMFHLGPLQARIVKHLHKAAIAGTPWCVGKVVLAKAGSLSTRMSDVFKSQPQWRSLVESDRKGRYRLLLPSR